ncbi:glycoside hydrolase family 18 protein [Ilyonectria robusta]
MLPSKGFVTAALLLSGVQARFPRARLAARDVDTTTPEPATTTTHFLLPFETTTPAASTDVSTFVTSAESTDSTNALTPVVDTTTTTEASITTDASTTAITTDASTISVSATTEASTTEVPATETTATAAPTTAETSLLTGTGALIGVPTAATNAASSFTDLAAAASSIAANPTPSAEEVNAFQQRAEEESEELQRIQDQLQQVDRDSLSDDDSHRVEAALIGLAALLGWFSTQLAALAPAVTTTALAPAVFADLATAFGTAAAGGLLADALDGLEDLGNEDDDGDDNDDPTNTEQSSAASSTASETTSTTSSAVFCSAIPYELNLQISDDDDNSSDNTRRRSVDSFRDSAVQLHERGHIEKRARTPFFGFCKNVAPPSFPSNPSAQQMIKAEDKPTKQNQDWIDKILRWYDRKDCEGGDLTPGWTIVDSTIAKAKGAAAGGMSEYWTVDHVWELKFFTDFFEIDLVPSKRSTGAKLTCDEFDTIFMTPYACGKAPKTVMQQLVEKAPSSAPKSTQLEFVIMQKQINQMKGAMFKIGELKEDGFTSEFSGSTLKTIQTLEAIGNAVDIFNYDPVKALFEMTNQRMYNSFQGIDQFVTDKAIDISGGGFSFAEMYQTFMDDRLNSDAAAAWEFVQTWTTKVETDIAALDEEDENKKTLTELFDAFKASKYADAGHYSFSANRDLAGAGGDVIGFKRGLEGRDDGDGDSCPISTTETSTAAVTTTESNGQSTTAEESTTEQTTSESTAVTTTGEASSTTATTEQTTEQTTTESTVVTTTESNATTETTSDSIASTTEEATSTESTLVISSTATTFSTAVISRSTSEESSTITSSTESESTSTRTTPNIRTVTSDGMVCTLIEGSLHPVCTPINVPTANPDGTNIHVNHGCILINNSPRCASDAGSISSVYESSYNVASNPDEPYSTALILSGFDSSVDNHLHALATCQLQARWPANYGDVYFGEDGCLYDSESNKIFDQCCSTPDVNNNGPATNPYAPPAPSDSEQDHGNHDGSAICASISKDTCLYAAARYVDDVVYHQYTSAVWPDDTGKDIASLLIPTDIIDFFGINYGCTVIWTCDNDDAFSQGMTGKQIKDSMLNIYNLNGAKGCGSTYLDNACHVTVNGCNNCRDAGHAQTLWSPVDVYERTYDDANDGFPPMR